MTVTLTLKTAALLRAKAEREGQDVDEMGNALLMYALEKDDCKQAETTEAKRNLPNPFPREEVFAGEEGVGVLGNNIQYISDAGGKELGVIVPIELWREIKSERETAYLLKGIR